MPLVFPLPALILQAEARTTLLEDGLVIEHVVSLNEKPVPFTPTFIPICPDIGVRVIEGPVTVNVASTKTPEGLPVTRTVYGPGATLATTKLPVKLPPVEPEITQLFVPVTVPVIVQVVSLPPSEPFTKTVVARGPVVGLIVIAVIVNAASAASFRLPPAIPVTMTVYGFSIEVTNGTMKEPDKVVLPADLLQI